MTTIHFEQRTSAGWVEDTIVFPTAQGAMLWIDYVAANFPTINVSKVES